MTTPFVSYAFKASGADVTTAITLPTRLTYVKNVKDFGAKGDGVTDDYAAIMAAFNWTVSNFRGTLFFPPGTYLVSQSLDFGDSQGTVNIRVCLQGVGPLSTIIGNFADYIISRGASTGDASDGSHVVADIGITNLHASGGGIRWGLNAGAALRNLLVSANRAINVANADAGGSIPSQETGIWNCILTPGANPTNSIGVMTVANGPVMSCYISGFQTGAMCWGQQGGHLFMGTLFDRCSVGIGLGQAPGISPPGDPGCGVFGCSFQDCLTAIDASATGGCIAAGDVIQSTGASVFGSTPQYGINGANNIGTFEGIYVTGDFAQTGINMSAVTSAFGTSYGYRGVAVNNTNGMGFNWKLPSSSAIFTASNNFKACNVAVVYTMNQVPAWPGGVNSGAWAANAIFNIGAVTAGSGYFPGQYTSVRVTGGSGTGALAHCTVDGSGHVITVQVLPTGSGFAVSDTLSLNNADMGGAGSGAAFSVTDVDGAATLRIAGNLSPYLSPDIFLDVTVSGITPAGYNGFYSSVTVDGTHIAYRLASNPGVGGSGAILMNPDNQGSLSAAESDCYNVSDANVSTWGNATVGGGSTHAKVRWTGSNWSIVGK
jgi:hypothetical protein